MPQNKILRGLITVIFVTTLTWVAITLWPKSQGFEGENPFKAQNDRPHIIAHAGGNMEFPDNTLEAMYNAYSVDKNVILEMDVALTADGVVVLSHDTTFDRKTTLIDAPVHEINYSDLIADAIDFGYENPIDRPNGTNVTGEHIRYTNYQNEHVSPLDVDYPEGAQARHDEKFLATTLEDVITAFPDNYMIVELKQHGEQGALLLDAVIALFDDLDESYNVYDRVMIASFDRQMYDRYVDLKETTHPQLLFSPQEDKITVFYVLHLLRITTFFAEKVSAFQVPMGQDNINLATENFVTQANKHNIAIHYWTINDEADMRKLIEIGADGILTDRPTLLKSVIDDMTD